MSIDSLYQIKKLHCAYKANGTASRIILSLDDFVIPKNKMIFILGRSGIGKSTILEALGLMNNTLSEGSEVMFRPTAGESYNLSEIWRPENKQTLSKVRNNHFSFIFQETNLMPNFTVYENICFTQMLQGETYQNALAKVKKTMKEVGLSTIEEHKKVYELSGGQKQRVAFVRAITPKFSILFGDEPTGNLDESNAGELMSILRTNILGNQRTAVIVSHDINLALKFADMIVLISHNNDRGGVQKEHIYESETPDIQGSKTKVWRNKVGEISEDTLINEIRNILKLS